MPLRVAPWTLLVALVPLFWVTVYPPEPAEERLGRWLDLHPEQVASAQACKNAWELVRALPEKRIPGALLPHDSLLHWALAPLSALLFLGWILVALPRGGIGVPRLAIETLRTAILGTCFLWICQYVVENPGSGSFVGTSYEIFFIYLMFFLAYSYASALNPESGFWMSLFGFTFGVGLCEELCKIWPVTRQVRRSARGELHDLVVLGLVSGVGLGSAEALTYCGNYYHGFAVGDLRRSARHLRRLAWHLDRTCRAPDRAPAAVGLRPVRHRIGYGAQHDAARRV
ncbi:MAG: PrsW family intramembrane metalloprotease [Planctomycetes bacterium]|nr:PrsW family intramembrane metalloprotease [Planctomycetota bacterium]